MANFFEAGMTVMRKRVGELSDVPGEEWQVVAVEDYRGSCDCFMGWVGRHSRYCISRSWRLQNNDHPQRVTFRDSIGHEHHCSGDMLVNKDDFAEEMLALAPRKISSASAAHGPSRDHQCDCGFGFTGSHFDGCSVPVSEDNRQGILFNAIPIGPRTDV